MQDEKCALLFRVDSATPGSACERVRSGHNICGLNEPALAHNLRACGFVPYYAFAICRLRLESNRTFLNARGNEYTFTLRACSNYNTAFCRT